MSINRPLAGFRFVEIQQDDTLVLLAARELGDANKWRDIVAINNLLYPYVTGDPAVASDRVKLYGQLITIPAAVAQVQASADPDRVFGVDLKLEGGQLSIEDGDFALISGRANLRQALANRLNTALRELAYHLDYGNGAWSLRGKVNGPTGLQLAAQYVKSALLGETRVSVVQTVNAVASGDKTQIQAKVTPVAGASIDLTTLV